MFFTASHAVSPALTEIPQDTNSSLGEDLILSCVADGFPVPSIVWVYNGAEIDADSSARITITAEQSVPGQRNSTLIITSAQFSDSGEYVCNATTTEPSFETVTSGPVQVDIQGFTTAKIHALYNYKCYCHTSVLLVLLVIYYINISIKILFTNYVTLRCIV